MQQRTPQAIAQIAKLRRARTMAALAARRQWHALAGLGFHWMTAGPRQEMRSLLRAAALYRNV